MGTSLTNDLYADKNKSDAFKVRGLVNSINTILSPAISGFIIYYFSSSQIVLFCLFLALISGGLFYGIRDISIQEKSAKQTQNVLKVLYFNPVERWMVLVSILANFVITPIIAYVIPYNVYNKFNLPAFYVGLAEKFFWYWYDSR